MKLVGIFGLIALLCMFFYALKSHKSPYDKEIEKLIEENRQRAFEIMQRVKNKRK